MDSEKVLDEIWPAKRNLVVSQHGARIDFHGGSDLWDPLFLTEGELDKVTDTLVERLLHRRVSSINLKRCKSLTDESIKAIAYGCPELKELNVCAIKGLTGKSIEEIAKRCPELKELNVSSIEDITDESIMAIAAHCRKLKVLNVSSCSNLTDASIKAIAKGCTELKELHITGHPQQGSNLTDESIEAIVRGCPLLSTLKAIECGLTLLPNDIGDRLPELRELDVFQNKLTMLPPSIVKLKHLCELDVDKNPLQSPPLEIVRQGMDAIKRYFAELGKGEPRISKLLKVVLVGDGKAGKTSLRRALAGDSKPRQPPDHRTTYVDIEKITLRDDLDINVYDCGGQEEYVVTQLPYLTGVALYLLVVEAGYATDKNLNEIERKVHRFLVVLQNRVPGAIVLPIVTKMDTVRDREQRCKWLEDKIKMWLEKTSSAVGQSGFTPLQVLTALAVSVDEPESVGKVRGKILGLTKHEPPLLRGIGQKIPSTYMAVLELFGAIAENGDDDNALNALLEGRAQGLGETRAVSSTGTYRSKKVLKALWNKYCERRTSSSDKWSGKIDEDVFDKATQLWADQGLVFTDAGLVVLRPSFIKELVQPLVDRRLKKENAYFERTVADIGPFVSSAEDYMNLKEGVNSFRDSGELTDSLLLSFIWRGTRLEMHHYSQVLELLESSGVICRLQYDAGGSSERSVAVVPSRLTEPNQAEREEKWPLLPAPNEREFVVHFVPSSGLPTGLAGRFAAEVHRLGKSRYAWESGVIVQGSVKYTALAERVGDKLVLAVRFPKNSRANAKDAWRVLCCGQQIFKQLRERLFPGLYYDIRLLCEECRRHQQSKRKSAFADFLPGRRLHREACLSNAEEQSPATQRFDAKETEFRFQPCNHSFRVHVDECNNDNAELKDFWHNDLLEAKREIIHVVLQQMNRMQTTLQEIARKEYEFPKLFMIEPVDKDEWSCYDYLTFVHTIVNRSVRIVFLCEECLKPAHYNGQRGLEFSVPQDHIASVLESGQAFCEKYGLAIRVSSMMLVAAMKHLLGVDPNAAIKMVSDALSDAVEKHKFLRYLEFVETIDHLSNGKTAGRTDYSQSHKSRAIESYHEFGQFLKTVGFDPQSLQNMEPVTNQQTGHFQWVHKPTCPHEPHCKTEFSAERNDVHSDCESPDAYCVRCPIH